MRRIPDPKLRQEYRRRIWRFFRARPEPGLLFLIVIKCAMHYHLHRMAQDLARGGSVVYNTI